MFTKKTILIVVIAFITIFGMTAVFAGTSGATYVDADGETFDSTADHNDDHNESDNDDHSHEDDQPENEDNPENPPCDADHGHPGNQSEECDEDDPGESGDHRQDDQEDEEGGESEATCTERGAFTNETIAYQAFGTENESGPISSGLHDNEGEFQDLNVIVHEGSCVVATVDNNF